MATQVSTDYTIHLAETVEPEKADLYEDEDNDTWVLKLGVNAWPHGRAEVTIFGTEKQLKALVSI